MDDEIRECNAVDAATWCTIVLGRLENAQVKGTGASQSLSPNVRKAYVANVIIVAAVDSEKPKAIGIIAKDVAVVDVDTLKGFATFSGSGLTLTCAIPLVANIHNMNNSVRLYILLPLFLFNHKFTSISDVHALVQLVRHGPPAQVVDGVS